MLQKSRPPETECDLDRILIQVDEETYGFFLKVLDEPSPSEGLKRLMSAPPTWNE